MQGEGGAAGREIRRYADARGRAAIAVKDAHGGGWKLTFVDGKLSTTYACRSFPQMRRVLREHGKAWKEEGRWLATTLTA